MSDVNFIKLLFDEWETTKDDFTYNSCDEHFAISKFLNEIINSSTDQRWAITAKNISIKVSSTYYCSSRRKEKIKKSDYVSMQLSK
jgi:hypothetical protein